MLKKYFLLPGAFFVFTVSGAVTYEKIKPDTLPVIRPVEQQEQVPSGFREVPYVEHAAEPVPTDAEKKAGMILFTRELTAPVWAETRPFPRERFEQLSAWGAPGQFVLLNFAVYPLEELKNLKVRTHAALQPEMTRIGYWKSLYPFYNSHQLKQYRRGPDYMIPLTVCDAPKKEPQRFVLSFRIPDDAKAGVLKGQVQVYHDASKLAATFPFEISVLDIKLKKAPGKHYSAYATDMRSFHAPFFKQNRNNEKLLHELQLREFRQMRDFGFTRAPHFLLRYDSSQDALRIFDMDRIFPELKEAGFDPREPVMLSGCGEYYLVERYTGQKLQTHYPGITDLPDAYYQKMDSLIGKFLADYRSKNYPPLIFNPVDEPSTENLPWLKKLYALFQKHGAKTLYTSASVTFRRGMDKEIDIYSDGFFRAPYEQAVSGDKVEYWCYPNNVSYQIRDPLAMCQGGRMWYGFGFWRSGYHMLMPWIWRLDKTDHFTGRFANLQLPDGTVAPGLYWACFREGVYDLNYLYTLQDAAWRRVNSKDPACRKWVQQAFDLVARTWKEIPERVDYSTSGSFPHAEFDARRAEFATLILKLQKYPETRKEAAPVVAIKPVKSAEKAATLLDPASAAALVLNEWKAVEREAQVQQKDDITELRIGIDHKSDGWSKVGAPPKYLCGWPHMRQTFAGGLDIGRFQYVAFDIRVDSNRDAEMNEHWPIWVQIAGEGKSVDIHNFGTASSRLQPATWHSCLLDLGEARKLNEASLIRIGVNELEFTHGANLDIQVRNPRLIAFRKPSPFRLNVPQCFSPSSRFLPVQFDIAGPGNSDVAVHIGLQDAKGKVHAKSNPAYAPYINEALDVSHVPPGNYTLVVSVGRSGEKPLSVQRDIRITGAFPVAKK